MAVKVTINGEERVFERELSLRELLKELDIEFREVGLAISVNGEIIPKSAYDVTCIKEGDSIEIVQLVGGG